MDQGWMEEALREWREARRPESLGELFKAQRNRAYSVAYRLTASSAEAEDVVQEAFLKLLTRTTGFDDLEAFELSVYRAVVQCALDARRKTRRRQAREDAVRTVKSGDPPVFEAAPQATHAEMEEVRSLLRSAVTQLPDDERAPVALCYFQGMSVVQTARVLELPRETVRARLARALERLRAYLKQNNRDIGAAVILPLLWQDGATAAPDSLCAALDKILPGRPGREVDAPTHFSAAQTAPAAGLTRTAVLLPVAIALAVLGLVGDFWTRGARPVQPAAATVAQRAPISVRAHDAAAPVADTGESTMETPRLQPGQVDEPMKEDDPVKSKLGAIVLAGGLLLPAALQAGEPDAKVADAVAQIAARREAKDAAAAAVIAKYSQRESRERGSGASGWNAGTKTIVVPASSAAPGTTSAAGAVIQIKE